MSRRSQVLEALTAAAEKGLSGETLAGELGVSRVAIAKHVAALRESGYVIDAAPRRGYLLRSVPDLPLPEQVEPLVADPFWVRFEGGPVTESTNEDAKRLARGGTPEGTVVVAGAQTGGKGRLGRRWDSPEGGVYLSIVLRPSLAPAEIVSLPLVISVGVARGLEALGCRPLLKWPNDVWLAGPLEAAPPAGKVSGILLEMQAEADCVEWVVAGIGINVRPAQEVPAGVAHVFDHVEPCSTSTVAAAVLTGISSAYREFRASGFQALLPEYERRNMLAGREVTVRELDGSVRARGAVDSVDPLGRLVLASGSGMLAVASGDVTLRELDA